MRERGYNAWVGQPLPCPGRRTGVLFSPWLLPWVFSSAQQGQRTSSLENNLHGCCFCVVFPVAGLGPGALAYLFENPVVHGYLFVACLVLFAWRLCIAALLCLVCLIVGGQFRTITCRQIRLAHSSVCQGSHTLAHPSDLRLDKGCKTLLSLSLPLPEQPLLLGLLHVHTTIGLDLLASIGGIVSCLYLLGACSGFYSLGWALISCQLFSDLLLGVSMLPEPIGSAHVVVVWLLQMNCT